MRKITFQQPGGLIGVTQVQGTLRCLAPELKNPENQQNKFIFKLQTCEKSSEFGFLSDSLQAKCCCLEGFCFFGEAEADHLFIQAGAIENRDGNSGYAVLRG